MFSSIAGWVMGLSWISRIFIGAATVGTAALISQPLTFPSQPPDITTEIITEEEVIPFEKVTNNDPNIDTGTTKIGVIGENGIKLKTYKITYSSKVQTNKELISESVKKAPVNEVTIVGTKAYAPVSADCDPNYTPCVPNVSYDLDCPDIGFNVRVIGIDTNGFDRDGDGYGCESY